MHKFFKCAQKNHSVHIRVYQIIKLNPGTSVLRDISRPTQTVSGNDVRAGYRDPRVSEAPGGTILRSSRERAPLKGQHIPFLEKNASCTRAVASFRGNSTALFSDILN